MDCQLSLGSVAGSLFLCVLLLLLVSKLQFQCVDGSWIVNKSMPIPK